MEFGIFKRALGNIGDGGIVILLIFIQKEKKKKHLKGGSAQASNVTIIKFQTTFQIEVCQALGDTCYQG